MAQATTGNTVSVHYTGTLSDGTVFDTSASREPLEFTIGEHQVIPGFENGITGMAPGDKKTITIPADQAYGPRRDDMLVTFERSDIPAEITPEVGQQLVLRDDQGNAFPALVADVTDAEVTVDANHPLAGEDLTFELELVGIK